MEKLCISLREHAANVINFEKKKNVTLTEEDLKFNQHSAVCYICKKKFTKSLLKIKNIVKLETIAILLLNIEVQHITFVI